MPTIITPEVGRLHWDDLSRLFRVCASIQIDSALGINPHYEVCVDAGDLATALTFITKTFTTVGTTFLDPAITIPVGDTTELFATLTAAAAVLSVVPARGLEVEGNPGPMEGLEADPIDWGVTTP